MANIQVDVKQKKQIRITNLVFVTQCFTTLHSVTLLHNVIPLFYNCK